MIAQKAADLPFDIRNYRCIIYKQTVEGLQRLQRDLVASLQEIEKWRAKPSNPVQDFKPHDAFVLQSEFERLQKEMAEKQVEISTLQKELLRLRQPAVPISAPPPPKKLLRSQPLTELSVDAVKKMLKEKDFFDSSDNKQGKGLPHQYEAIEQDGEKLVIDHATGLTWQQSGSPNSMSFADAEKHVLDLNAKKFAGFNDWRMPTLEEAMSLMEPKKSGDLYIDPMFDRKQAYIWTADKADSAGVAWVVVFDLGGCYFNLVTSYVFVRVVR